MAAQKSTSAKTVAYEILSASAEPMGVKQLAEAVVSSGRTKLAGKTPHATIAAQIYTSAKKGELFKQVDRGKFVAIPKTVAAADAPETEASEAGEKADDEHDPRGDVPGTVVVRNGRQAKPDPKPQQQRGRSRAKAAA